MLLSVNRVDALAIVPVLKDMLTPLHSWVILENSEALAEAEGKDVDGLDQKGHPHTHVNNRKKKKKRNRLSTT